MNFKYDIFDVNNGFSKEELLGKKDSTSAIFLLDQKIDLQEFLDRLVEIQKMFNSISSEQQKAIKHWLKNTLEDDVAKDAIDILEKDDEERVNMVANNSNILREYEEKFLERGIEKGIATGLSQGERKKSIEIAKKLLKMGMSLEDISIATELEIEEIEEIRKQSLS